MIAEQFIDRLEQQGLLDANIVAELRRRIARVEGKKITPEVIAKFLVDKGHLTRFQATRLISEITTQQEAAGTERPQPGKEPSATETADELHLARNSEDDLLVGLTPDKPKPQPKPTSKPEPGPIEAAPDDLVLLDDDSSLPPAPKSSAKPVEPAPPRTSASPAAKPTASTTPAAEPSGKKNKKKSRDHARSQPPADLPASDDLAELESSGEATSGRQKEGGLFGMFSGSGATPRQQLAARKLQPTSQWDSKLLLIGSASLGVLIVIGAFLVMSLTRGSAEEILGAANKEYEAGSYAQAMKLYDQYLKYYSGHDDASYVRVFRSLARLRQVYSTPEQGLTVAQEVLPEIETEEAFNAARPELASMLPQIAEGFIEKAKLSNVTDEQRQLLASTVETMALIDNPNYVPTTLRRAVETKIDSIKEDMARVQRQIDREKNLVNTIAAIENAVQREDTVTAYQARQALLDKYPGLEAEDRLYEAVLKITEKERERIHTVAEPLAAESADPAPIAPQQVILAHRRGPTVSSEQGYIVYVLAGGSVFALDAANGNVLWRRFIGLETSTFPLPLAEQRAGSDAIVVDRRTQELMRLDAKTGTLKWRLPIQEPFADPVIAEKQIFVATHSGKLYAVDPESGGADRHAAIPQPLAIGPGVAPKQGKIYLAGEHDNLYVLDATSLECQEVLYLGHKPGSIAVPPVMALGFLIVVENGADFARVHVFGTDENGLKLRRAQSEFRLRGRVLVPPVVGRRRILLVTDMHAVELYDVDPANQDGSPLMSAASKSATNEDPVISYPLLDRGFLWIADNRLTKYQVQASTGKLPPEWVKDEQDVYVAPIQLVRDLVVTTARRRSAEGIVVAANSLQEKNPVWQTELAVPILNAQAAGADIECLSARGRLFTMTADPLPQAPLNEAQYSAAPDDVRTLLLDCCVPIDDQHWALTAQQGYTQIVFYQPAGKPQPLRMLTLTVPQGEATGPPAPFGGGVLVPRRTAQLSLMDMTTGADRVYPYRPELPPGTTVQWSEPVVGADGKEFVIADSQRNIYRVTVENQPEPHLAEAGHTSLTGTMAGPLVQVGALVAGVADDSALLSYRLPTLEKANELPLDGRVLWGPIATENTALVATATKLTCLGPDGKEAWSVALDHGVPVGRPLIDNGSLLLATQGGTLWRLDPKTGSTLAATSVGEPLTLGPTALGDQLLVATKSGVLLVVPAPRP